ncbi:DDE superfamily endonuclease [Popillia japonica]|uniref:DDE superfamily endonuclease n=1 Tax=Popillia japonica TaxID=7064 RepID=A0AAW1LYV1_POPJA
MNARLMINTPNENAGEAQPNRWMKAELFFKWMHHFVKYSNPIAGNPLLLILDGHASNDHATQFAMKNHIHMLNSLPHTTHKLQPLYCTFMKPFKSAYNDVYTSWMRPYPGVRMLLLIAFTFSNECCN